MNNPDDILTEIKKWGPIDLDPATYHDLDGSESDLKNKMAHNAMSSLDFLNPNENPNKLSMMFGLMQFNNNSEQIRKQNFIQKFGYSVPSKSSLDEIVKFCDGSKILEIGSGLGIWSRLMVLNGSDAIATDIGTSGLYYKNFKNAWTKIEFFSCEEAIQKYNSVCDVLFMSWPPRENIMAVKSIELFSGNKIIYIGECFGGSCADDNFFNILRNKWTKIKVIKIPRWKGLYDRMYFYVRKV